MRINFSKWGSHCNPCVHAYNCTWPYPLLLVITLSCLPPFLSHISQGAFFTFMFSWHFIQEEKKKKTLSNPTRAAPLCETGLYRITRWPSVSSISEQEAWFHSSYTWVALCCVCSLHLIYPLIIHGWASPYMGLQGSLQESGFGSVNSVPAGVLAWSCVSSTFNIL